jgi:outer membrane receptor for monomeric catechols
MHIRPLRIIAATALLLCCAGGVFAADAGRQRTAAGWAHATHRSASGLHARRVPGGRRVVGRGSYVHPKAVYNANRLSPSWPVRPTQLFDSPGATVIPRQDLDALNATTLRDALRYAPGVLVK